LFLEPGHLVLFEVIKELWKANEPISVSFVRAIIQHDGKQSMLDTLDISKIVDAGFQRSGWESFTNTLLAAAQRRRIHAAGARLTALSKVDELSIAEIQEQAENAVFGCRIAAETNKPESISSLVEAGITRWDRAEKTRQSDRIPTGAGWFDSTSGGYRSGELVILGARPSVGKTALACNTLLAFAEQKRRCVFFSLEMGKAEITDRLMACAGQINPDLIACGNYTRQQVMEAAQKVASRLSCLDITIDDHGSPTVTYLRSRLREAQRRGPIGLVIVDYLQLIRSDKRAENRNVEIGAISRDLKLLAKQFGCTVLALSQLNRGGVEEEPGLHHLRDSGSIEQDADQVAFLWQSEKRDFLHFKVAKNRNGRTGDASICFDRNTQTMIPAHMVRDGQTMAIVRTLDAPEMYGEEETF
jgi:replicative DNA helicase